MLLMNANIWTMDGEDIPNGYVQIVDKLISSVGPMKLCPRAQAGEEVVDIAGKLLIPGFIDAHTHIGLYSSGLGLEGDDLNEDSDPCTPNFRALDGIDPFDSAFENARQSGVTCVVVTPGSTNPIAGQICAIKTYGISIDKMIVAQPIAIKFAFGENPKMSYGQKPQTPVTRMGIVAIIREQLTKAQRYLSEIDRANLDDEIDLPEFDAKLEALIPLLRKEISAHMHSHKAYDILTGVRILEEFNINGVIVHGTEGYLVADILAEKNIPVICGPIICAHTKPELAGQSMQNCTLLSNAGVNIAISTDHPEVPQELLLMSASLSQANGMDERAVIRAITIDAANILGLGAKIGSVTEGKSADLLVFSDDLMKVGTKPDMVFIDGCWIK